MTFSRPRGRGERRRLQIALSAAVLGIVALATLAPAAQAQQTDPPVFINELHYDNTGTDAGESVEIAGPAGTDLSGYSIVLYNGSGGASYDTDTLSGTIPNQQNGFGTVALDYPANGIQNGGSPMSPAADGIALVQGTTIIQFLSYEGSFAATDGPANGVTSTDIGRSETGSEPVGQSLQLLGTGNSYADFSWSPTAISHTKGQPNTGQTFQAPPAGRTGIVVSEFRFRGPNGGNDEFVELRNTSNAPIDISGYRLEGCSSGGPSGTRATVPANTPPLAPGEAYLLVNVNRTSGPYSGTENADLVYTTGISDTGGARILDAQAGVVDRAGSRQTTSDCREGAGLNLPTENEDRSFERKQNGTQDTDDNPADFESRSPSDPDNRTLRPVRPVTKIHNVQGSGARSPFAGEGSDPGQTATVEGIVTGIDDEVGQSSSGSTFANERGVFVQEETTDEDGNPSTSEGIFVGFVDNIERLPIGTRVRVTGQVRELFGFTILEEQRGEEPEVLQGTAPVTTVPINQGQAEAQSVGEDGTRSYYETVESMRVSFAASTANSGGTNKFDELFLTPGSVRNRVFRTDTDQHPELFATDEDAGSGNPEDPDNPGNPKSTTTVNADLFDRVNNLAGPFAFSFENYKVMVQEGQEPTVSDTGVPYPYQLRPRDRNSDIAGLRAFNDATQLRVLSYNLNNYFDNTDDPDKDDEFDETTDREPEKRARATDAINNILKRPEILSVQEAENKGVLDRFAQSLRGYTAYLAEGNDERGIDNGFLIRNDVRVSNFRQLGKDASGPAGCSDVEGRLFDRPPIAADITTANGLRFTVFGSHFAAKGGDGPEDGRAECRQAQARFLRDQVQGVVDRGAQAVIAGDLNAFEDESPLQILEQGGLLDNQFDKEIPQQRYSFQFGGKLQTLDHVLITRGLNPRYREFQYAHFNEDYHERERRENQMSTDGHKLSVHDPPILTLDDSVAKPPPPPPPPPNRGQPGRTINGTKGNDMLVGTAGNDVINCGPGNDKVNGRGGNDVINCGPGNDMVLGGAGNDRISGGSGDDLLRGESGNDRIRGDSGDDSLDGGSGDDTVDGGADDDSVRGGPGRDTVTGGTGRNSVSQ